MIGHLHHQIGWSARLRRAPAPRSSGKTARVTRKPRRRPGVSEVVHVPQGSFRGRVFHPPSPGSPVACRGGEPAFAPSWLRRSRWRSAARHGLGGDGGTASSGIAGCRPQDAPRLAAWEAHSCHRARAAYARGERSHLASRLYRLRKRGGLLTPSPRFVSHLLSLFPCHLPELSFELLPVNLACPSPQWRVAAWSRRPAGAEFLVAHVDGPRLVRRVEKTCGGHWREAAEGDAPLTSRACARPLAGASDPQLDPSRRSLAAGVSRRQGQDTWVVRHRRAQPGLGCCGRFDVLRLLKALNLTQSLSLSNGSKGPTPLAYRSAFPALRSALSELGTRRPELGTASEGSPSTSPRSASRKANPRQVGLSTAGGSTGRDACGIPLREAVLSTKSGWNRRIRGERETTAPGNRWGRPRTGVGPGCPSTHGGRAVGMHNEVRA